MVIGTGISLWTCLAQSQVDRLTPRGVLFVCLHLHMLLSSQWCMGLP